MKTHSLRRTHTLLKNPCEKSLCFSSVKMCALILQCTNGHLMCAGCFIHLLADARLKEEQATCPNCRCEISKSLCCRNLAVEKAVSELPSDCSYCLKQFPRSSLDRHQTEECQDRYCCTYLQNTHPNEQDCIQHTYKAKRVNSLNSCAILFIIHLFSAQHATFKCKLLWIVLYNK